MAGYDLGFQTPAGWFFKDIIYIGYKLRNIRKDADIANFLYSFVSKSDVELIVNKGRSITDNAIAQRGHKVFPDISKRLRAIQDVKHPNGY